MGLLAHLYYPWGIVLQGLAILHFIRRRPDNYWLWIIIIFGPIGALIYLAVEAAPDLSLVRTGFKAFPRRRHIREMRAVIAQNPSPGNYEELADLLFEDKKYTEARECYDHAITKRSDTLDPFYRRGLCKYEMKDYQAAIEDLEFVVARQASYDFHRAAGLLAACYAQTRQTEKADALFRRVLEISTATETQYNYAEFLSAQGRTQEARALTDQIVAKKALMKRFQKRLERPWLRRTASLRKRLQSV